MVIMSHPSSAYLTRQEAANRLHVSPGRITQLFNVGVLEGYRIGEGRRCQLFIMLESVQRRIDNPGKPGNPKWIK
jgi:excisionase family DNA binding protein